MALPCRSADFGDAACLGTCRMEDAVGWCGGGGAWSSRSSSTGSDDDDMHHDPSQHADDRSERLFTTCPTLLVIFSGHVSCSARPLRWTAVKVSTSRQLVTLELDRIVGPPAEPLDLRRLFRLRGELGSRGRPGSSLSLAVTTESRLDDSS